MIKKLFLIVLCLSLVGVVLAGERVVSYAFSPACGKTTPGYFVSSGTIRSMITHTGEFSEGIFKAIDALMFAGSYGFIPKQVRHTKNFEKEEVRIIGLGTLIMEEDYYRNQ